ncbi:orf109 [Sucra jujuba nucleopolyhedrovirus]|uniref:Orf109 n=1 Tax=Sucra jujuba nucleopolyhedrovirus TaxID=1563660 RepID=A0A097P953_9ABAC|nr:orf109 [Sucra jujuba nucleopolyhedrovirus]AIU41348.1 orf109 [Sucra jujuba nucleopolyhedrovirus]
MYTKYDVSNVDYYRRQPATEDGYTVRMVDRLMREHGQIRHDLNSLRTQMHEMCQHFSLANAGNGVGNSAAASGVCARVRDSRLSLLGGDTTAYKNALNGSSDFIASRSPAQAVTAAKITVTE